jgi:hypothetical protein
MRPAVSTSPSSSPIAARTRSLLEDPIVPTLLRLAAPNIAVMAVQTVVSTGEVYFIGWLGSEALAGVALVYPLIMLMQTMSAGGMGGGVASAVARPGRWPPRRAGPSAACSADRVYHGWTLHDWGTLGRPAALPDDGWHG